MTLARLIAKATKWPTFLGSILLLYWSVVFVALSYHIKWLKLKGRRNDVLGWAAGMKWWIRCRVLKVGTQELYRGQCVYLFNHRSWGDFIVDQYVTEGRSLFMSRLAVLGVFPTFVSALVVLKSIILFKRGSVADKEKFNRWIDEQRAASPQPGLSVYPEGHRSTLGEPLPLKRGMLHYAFSRKLPIVIGANKEAIISEKHCTARLNQTAVVGYSAPIMTANYPSFDAFWEEVQEAWNAQWAAVFGADWDGLPELAPQEPDTEYPASITLGMLGVVVANMALFCLTCWLSFRFWRWLFALFGPAQPVALAAAAGYLALAFWLYSRPVNALQLHAEKRRPGQLAQSATNVAALDGKKAS
ncbi:hypothetical protein CHLNCDRAFT_133550 [Chlorella variabilis]|uniref:Phospholipid/glycerol acyltransferase domain-containing protein n=1 Tax=Chlorella variabilis TaxID=554065 RepID=E1Z3B5_CHLVA|nr:hypothetical protein CHLNCDRAFT_133550 [Chlorella variabilis]EFN60141.1 hypothetical protein CHLNCDRAFT_133550 [Chlorella variabilis]|eukprot:XP_005852243.1 hypothetical protein CHLNCDRAFT_133550 [Chlorella variabilis]